MTRLLFLLLYNLFLPLFLLVSLPGYVVKMRRRGGFGTGLSERFGIYRRPPEEEPKGGLYVHAVSVGEVFIALKFIREWLRAHPDETVVLATATATGHEVIRKAALPQVRALYAPLDVPGLSERCLSRFAPQAVVLIEAELWPNFAEVCHRRHIPMLMLNARLSPRSEGRYAKARPLTRLLFSRLSAMGVQNERDAQRFVDIGVNPGIIHVTGSIKFDVLGDEPSRRREDFQAILDTLREGRPVILAASTHAGEETLCAQAIQEAGGFPLIVPRHAERREEVVNELRESGFTPILRTEGRLPSSLPERPCYIADTTGELKDWTALAAVAIIGKSFLAKGGQNPVEAIAARVPVVTGSDMTNFADLVRLLEEADAIRRCDAPQLVDILKDILNHPEAARARCERACAALRVHSGATRRSVQLTDAFF